MATVITIRRGLSGWPYSACTSEGKFITNSESIDEIRKLYMEDIKAGRVKLKKETKLFPVGEVLGTCYGYTTGGITAEELAADGAIRIFRDTIPGGPEWLQLNEILRGGDTVIVSGLLDLALSVGGLWSVISGLISQRVSVVINGVGTFDNTPQSEPLRILLSAVADFDNGLPAVKARAGKAEARKRDGFREGRPPIDRKKIDAAMELLATHSYSETVKLTGISASTLARERRRRKAAEGAS